MSAKERLQGLQAALEARGVQDVKFYFTRDPKAPHTLVVQHAAEALEAILNGQFRPLPKFGDSVREANAS